MIAPPGRRPRGITEAEVLFAEAHRRRRRRRLVGGTACLLLAGLVAAGVVTSWPRHGAVIPGVPVAGRAPGVTLPPARVAWVDYGGQLHLGNLATRAQHVVATVDASPADPMILAGGRLYWASASKNLASIRDYDLATGRIRYLARGDSVFASANGRHIYIVQAPARLIELPATGIGRAHRLTLPVGWHMSGGLGNWSVAGGIVIYSGSAGQRRHPATLAVWTPETGHVKIIGRDRDISVAYTPRGASYSLLAWTSHGVLKITNTSTLASLTVRSPLRYGFTYGGLFSSGAFSPDGRRLAVFVNTTNPQDPSITPQSVLGIVNIRTGALRLVRTARLVTTEDVGWARWLPAGNRLIAGAEAGSYAVNAVTLAARPFSLSGSPGRDIENSGDINFSATVVPYPRTARKRSAFGWPGGFPAEGPQPPILPPRDGFLFLDRDKFHASFAGDLPADLAAFMADSQAPWGVDALGGPVTDPAWRVKPSWYLVTTEDQMIPPAAQRTMSQRTGSTVVEVAASHSVYVSQPDAVASLIKQAASAAAAQQLSRHLIYTARTMIRHPASAAGQRRHRGRSVRFPS